MTDVQLNSIYESSYFRNLELMLRNAISWLKVKSFWINTLTFLFHVDCFQRSTGVFIVQINKDHCSNCS